ncbi:CpXC domain-containing protein [Dolosicoccus paucivorans]|uniref:CpXC domain-containing protein n=1 Tax=Dolosicoccus paucivorans TaxID=84521 RepID=UPI0015E14569|nr:CpXC domain-containing protein [Dolosicoccus paucivorans]
MAQQTLHLTCPTCLASENQTFPTIIDGATQPDLSFSIQQGDFFDHQCAHCGGTHPVPFPFLYIHSSNKQGVYLYPHSTDSNEQRQAIFNQINDQFQNEYPDYQLRIVSSIESLKETLLIWQDKKSDTVVELVKILAQGAAELTNQEAKVYYYHHRLTPHLLYIKKEQQLYSPYPTHLETFVEQKYKPYLTSQPGTFLIINSTWAWHVLLHDSDLNGEYDLDDIG